MPKRTHTTQPTEPLPQRQPGATYPGSSTYAQPAAATRAPKNGGAR